jgi:hypothetical protein
MISTTKYNIPLNDVQSLDTMGDIPTKITVNYPTGDFFYDPWVIKPEFKGTAFESALSSLPSNIGEARVIIMKNGTSYLRHADIDDRYHLTVRSDEAYLIDLDSKKMHLLVVDGKWYLMDAGICHSAVVFGEFNRVQLVVRKLLNAPSLIDPVAVEILVNGKNCRYRFDNSVSSWLNLANKQKIMTDFRLTSGGVSFSIERGYVSDLQEVSCEFEVKLGDSIEH